MPNPKGLPKDLYAWNFYMSETDRQASLAVTTSGSGGYLQAVSFEQALEIRKELDKMTERIGRIKDGTDRVDFDQDTEDG